MMNGPRKLDAASGEEAGAEEAGAGVGDTMGPGSTPDETTGAGLPVGPTMGSRRDERRPPTGSLAEGDGEGVGLGVGKTSAIDDSGTAEDDAGTMTSGRPTLGISSGAGADEAAGAEEDAGTMTSGRPTLGTISAVGGDEGAGAEELAMTIGSGVGSGRSSSGVGTRIGDGDGLSIASGDEEIGTGDARKFPVPAGRSGRSFLSGSGVTIASTAELKVLDGSTFVCLTLVSGFADEVSGRPRNRDSTKDEKSSCRDSSCSDELLDDNVEDEEDEVGAAGAVMLVTICRFTWRGK
jgi:hypothetical protein